MAASDLAGVRKLVEVFFLRALVGDVCELTWHTRRWSSDELIATL